MAFDAYRKWLGISSKRRPPTYYDLLGIEPGESDNDVIVSALQQRRSFIRSKKGEGYDAQVRTILGQLDEAASTLLVPEFKNGYDRQLGLHFNWRRKGALRSYLLPSWMESRIVRIYGEGSGILFDAFGIISIIAVAIAIMVLSGLWLKTQTTESETSTELTWLERAAVPSVKKTDVPGNQAVAIGSTKQGIDSTTDSSLTKQFPKSYRSQATGTEFVLLPPGKFMMGSPESEHEHTKYETQHEVAISHLFYLGKYEVSQEEFEKVMGFNPSRFKDSQRLPVESVTWFEAVEFCNKLSELDGFQACYHFSNVEKIDDKISAAQVDVIAGAQGYRLPTEAEWEYACRAGTTTPFSLGTNISTDDVNYPGDIPYNRAPKGEKRSKTVEVQLLNTNPWGLTQIHGNVWEWCQDWMGNYESGPLMDPLGPSRGSTRVNRGGGWNYSASSCRSARRGYYKPNKRDSGFGFRVALAPPTRLSEVSLKDKDFAASADKTKDQQVPSEKPAEVDPKLGSSTPKPLPKALSSKTTAMEFVLIPSGTFAMGSVKSEVGHNESETRHEVTISHQFYMGKHEVTQAEFQRVMGFNPSKFTGSKRLPVENVTWFDAVWLCNKLSELDGYQACYQINNVEKDGDNIKKAEVVLVTGATGYRLPTEAEWEYACRAGTTTAFSFGDNVKTYQVNYDGKRAYNNAAEGTRRDKPIEVDAMKPNAWGLSQMHGNVWEWCQDWKGPYEKGPIIDPLGPSTGSVRVGRGGTWNFPASECRSAQRIHSLPSGRDGNLGFRVALVPPTELPSGSNTAIARNAQSSTYPISCLVEAKHSQDNDWHTAKVLENWEGLHLCRYESRASEFDEWVTPKRIRPLLAGDWLGTYQNIEKDRGVDSLKIKPDEMDYFKGLWTDIPIQGERIGPNVIYFEGVKNQAYGCIGLLQGDRLRLEYRVQPLPQGERYYGWSELNKTDVNGKAANADKPLTPQLDKRSFTGSWSGSFQNSKSDTGKENLTLSEKDDALSGTLSEMPVIGARISSTTFRLVGRNGTKLYNVVGRFEQDRLILHYTATSKDERYFGKSILTAK